VPEGTPEGDPRTGTRATFLITRNPTGGSWTLRLTAVQLLPRGRWLSVARGGPEVETGPSGPYPGSCAESEPRTLSASSVTAKRTGPATSSNTASSP